MSHNNLQWKKSGEKKTVCVCVPVCVCVYNWVNLQFDINYTSIKKNKNANIKEGLDSKCLNLLLSPDSAE